jgi:hypothetical protein
MTLRIAFVLALLFLTLAVPAEAQLQHATIAGSIAGPDNAVLDRVQVTLFDQLGSAETTVVASGGEFRIPNSAWPAPTTHRATSEAAPALWGRQHRTLVPSQATTRIVTALPTTAALAGQAWEQRRSPS